MWRSSPPTNSESSSLDFPSNPPIERPSLSRPPATFLTKWWGKNIVSKITQMCKKINRLRHKNQGWKASSSLRFSIIVKRRKINKAKQGRIPMNENLDGRSKNKTPQILRERYFQILSISLKIYFEAAGLFLSRPNKFFFFLSQLYLKKKRFLFSKVWLR